jgi:hypothetical protein
MILNPVAAASPWPSLGSHLHRMVKYHTYVEWPLKSGKCAKQKNEHNIKKSIATKNLREKEDKSSYKVTEGIY